MKKLIVIFGAFFIICLIVSHIADTATQTTNEVQSVERVSKGSSDTTQTIYTVKSENGRIVVYRGDELLIKTATAVNTLPKKDQTTLLYGVTAYSKEEMEQILEQYTS